MQRTTRWLLGSLWGLSTLMPLTASAVAVNFTGNLIQNPPCDVAGPSGINQPIKVAFGEVGITKIDG
ncbi:TPA: fimbrial protein, partial [Providencia rettgeri]